MTRAKKLKTARPSGAPLRLVYAEAGSLSDNPANWRRHPAGQMKAMKAVLADVGWAGALLFNETTGRLIDGHARKQAVSPETVVPVLVGRWAPEQEQKILLTLDPLSAMAAADTDALESLLAEVDMSDAALDDLATLLDSLAEDGADKPSAPAAVAGDAAGGERKRGPRMVTVVVGQFHFEVERQAYDAWLSPIEAKVSDDPDRIVREIRRRLKL